VVITQDVMLSLLASGHSLPWVRAVSGWRSRQVRRFAAHHGYLFSSSGAPYQLAFPCWRDADASQRSALGGLDVKGSSRVVDGGRCAHGVRPGCQTSRCLHQDSLGLRMGDRPQAY
jgi:hypothetical protein